MKRLALLAILVLMCGVSSFAQSSLYSKKFRGEPTNENVVKSPQWHLNNYEIMNKRAASFQYGALGCMAASIGCFAGYAALDTKYNYTFDRKGNVEEKSMRTCAKNYLIGGSALAAVAIICEAVSINCRLKAAKSMRIYATGNGAGLAFNF